MTFMETGSEFGYGMGMVIFIELMFILLGYIAFTSWRPKIKMADRKSLRFADTFVVFGVTILVMHTINFWFIQGNYGGSPAESLYLLLTIPAQIGETACFIYGFTYLYFRKFTKEANKNDAD